ncbi:MAG: hypothetical protein QG670_940 [Thermoproteota archaeon]|nr:hypothetical protein [Thermoproteota archaeon]
MLAKMAKKPKIAFVLSLIGGITVFFVGILISIATAVVTAIFGLGGLGVVLGLFGVVCGFGMILSAIMLYIKPKEHTIWSIIVIAFSILSWFGAAGGIFIGLILGLVGGIMGIKWKPSSPPVPTTFYLQTSNKKKTE